MSVDVEASSITVVIDLAVVPVAHFGSVSIAGLLATIVLFGVPRCQYYHYLLDS
jgi:hypothetical protein